MKKFIVFFVLSIITLACDSNEQQTTRLEVRLTDAPGDYEAVNINITGVEVHMDDGSPESGWMELNVEAGIYDLLKLTNGIDTLLATAELPAGRISQMRLILGDNNTIKVAGQEMPLTTPSGQQSGLKFNIQTDLTEGVVYQVLIDFDAAKSILQTGNSTYKLKPVIRTITSAESGAIKGVVEPMEANPMVFAIIGIDTIASTKASEAGAFLLRGLPAGTYSVSFNPKEGYSPALKTDITVTLGSVTDMGSVNIP
ncbi:MAG: DUF4382 domain-containing protein [Cyclobacteriaceae bacterium]